MTTGNDLESLISSTLNAFDESSVPNENEKITEGIKFPSNSPDSPESIAENDVDELLSKLKSAAPKIAETPNEAVDSDEGLMKLLDGLLTPESILDSMESLATEVESFLSGTSESNPDIERYRKQLCIYKEVSASYKLNANILEEESPEGERVRSRLAELQSLGSPPPEVVEKLMMSQLPEGNGEDLGKEFEQFLKEAGKGGLLPELTKEDEEMIKSLSSDPNALKNLLGGSSDKPGECSLM